MPCSEPFRGSLVPSGQAGYLNRAHKMGLCPPSLPALSRHTLPVCLFQALRIPWVEHLCSFASAVFPAELPCFLHLQQVNSRRPSRSWLDTSLVLEVPTDCSFIPMGTQGIRYSPLQFSPSFLPSSPPPCLHSFHSWLLAT